jgi:ABC-type antimicrobial peptide transport system permease subunit
MVTHHLRRTRILIVLNALVVANFVAVLSSVVNVVRWLFAAFLSKELNHVLDQLLVTQN